MNKLKKFLGSKYFFGLIIALTIAQGLWFSFTYQPGLFDEKHHFEFINMYTERVSPYFADQPEEWDFLGEIARDPSYLFYYLLSIPLRVVQLASDSYYAQVVALRLLMLVIFVAGLLLYRKLLNKLSGSALTTNISLLLLILLPVFSTLVSAINYDVAIFALTPLFLLIFLDILRKPTDIKKLSLFFFIGSTASLIKFSFLPIFLTAVAIILYKFMKNGVKRSSQDIIKSFKKLTLLLKFAVGVMMIVPILLLTERFVYNQVAYGRVTAPCVKILSVERCQKNYTAARSINFKAAKPENFNPVSPFEYLTTTWSLGMVRTQMKVVPEARTIPILENLLYVTSIVSITLILINLQKLLKNEKTKYLLIISGIYVLALFIENYNSYTKLAQPVAISFRYLLPLTPLIIMFALISLRDIFGKYEKFLAVSFAIYLFVLLTQGGSISSHLLSAQDYYWSKDSTVTNINEKLISPVVNKLVIYRSPF